ncbi:phage baseplate assembly protein V [Actinoplanes sp. NPDC048796]|uniref:phage baseplate assembly protein V n=1 Tax=Actinoplanes sp. NPDC048796 TaxID=3155640 RepID=UPI00340A815D
MDSSLWQRTGDESGGVLTGLAVGEVTDNKDPQNLARVRVRLPWHEAGDNSFWARLAMPMAGGGRGLYFLPEVGDEVLVAAESSDPGHLYVLGVLWNGRQAPPADNSDGANNTRLLKSRSGHTVRFNDDSAAPEIEVRLADGKRVMLDKDGITIDDANKNVVKLTGSGGAIEISATQQITVKAPTVSIEASGSLSVKSSGTLTLKGSIVQIN